VSANLVHSVPFYPEPVSQTQGLIQRFLCHNFLNRGKRLAVQKHNLNPLESALPRNSPITRLESALTNSLDLKSFRIRTYKKRWGEGVLLLTKSAATNPQPSGVTVLESRATNHGPRVANHGFQVTTQRIQHPIDIGSRTSRILLIWMRNPNSLAFP
jgi:hypothetical protein